MPATVRFDSMTRDDLPIAAREFWRAHELAAVLGVSTGLVKTMRKEGLIPAPIKFGPRANMVCWRARQIRAWIDAGCPHPANFVYKPHAVLTLDEQLAGLRRERAQLDKELLDLRAEVQRLEDRARELRRSVAASQAQSTEVD